VLFQLRFLREKLTRKLHFFKKIFFLRTARRFEINGTITGQYRRFNAVGTQIAVRLLPHSTNVDLVTHFLPV